MRDGLKSEFVGNDASAYVCCMLMYVCGLWIYGGRVGWCMNACLVHAN